MHQTGGHEIWHQQQLKQFHKKITTQNYPIDFSIVTLIVGKSLKIIPYIWFFQYNDAP